METNHSAHEAPGQISSSEKTSDVSCLKQAAADTSSRVKVEPKCLTLEASTVATPPSCESEPASADNPNEDDENETIFFTPELFEGDEGSPSRETESPPLLTSLVSGAQGSALLSEELFCSQQAQGQGEAAVPDKQDAVSVRKESTERSQGQKDEIRAPNRGEEGEQVDNQSRQAGSRLRRLSRSRHKVPSLPTGN